MKNSSHTQVSLQTTSSEDTQKNQILVRIGLFLGGLVSLAILVGLIYFLLLDTTPTDKIRDMMVIIMAFELTIIGVTTILLIIQIARMVNLFQNEIKPLLHAANETMGTLRGTATFIGDSLVQPVIKLNSYVAIFRHMLDLFNLKR